MMNMNKSTVTLDADGKPVDLHEPGALQALFAYRRKQWGGWTMEDDDDDDDDSDDDDDDADDDDSDDDDDDDDEELTPAQQRLIERAANRIADRRINQFQRRQRRRGRGRDDDDDSRGGGNRGRGRGRDDDDRNDDRRGRGGSADAVDPADAREARLVYREVVGDHIVIGKAERGLAQTLSRSLIDEHLADGLDVVDAGEAAAEAVAKRLKSYRRSVQSETIRRLQNEGHLPKEFEFKGQPKRGRERPGRQKPNQQTGKAIAEGLYADRMAAKTDS